MTLSRRGTINMCNAFKIALGLFVLSVFSLTAASLPAGTEATIRYFVLTAQPSPLSQESRSNAMERLQHGVIANGPEAVKTNPAALNMPRVLRACDIMSSPAGYLMWDATNNPSGAFASENGKRLGIGLDWKSTNRFLVSDIYFTLSSSDPGNVFSFIGNLATNTDGSPLSFSRTTLVGEEWDSAGNVIATHTTGLTTIPVNRVLAVVRQSLLCNNSNALASALDYFKNHLPFTNYHAFYMQSNGVVTSGFTNHLESPSRLGASPIGIVLEGQRNVPGFSYTLQGTENFTNWQDVLFGMRDGGVYTNPAPVRFFRTKEENASVSLSSSKPEHPASQMRVRVESGGE